MQKSRILIVDDDPRLSLLVQAMLKKTGLYTTVVQNRPFHAIPTAAVLKPDLILLDVDMPGKNGGDIAREIRQHPSLARTPIIFLTSLISSDEAGMRELGGEPARFLAKPPEPQVLLSAIEEVLTTAATQI